MKTLTVILGLLFAAHLGAAASAPTISDQYREAVSLYRQGDFVKAQKLFTAIKSKHPRYRKTTSYLARCREHIERDGPMTAYFDRAAEEAQELLDLRQTLLALVRKQYRSVTVQEQEGVVAFSFSPNFLFPGTSNDYSAAGTAFLGLVKDLALTYRSLHLVVVIEQPPAQRKKTGRREERQAVALGSFFFRHGGVPPQNLSLWSRPQSAPALRLELHTQTPPPLSNGSPIRGAMAEVSDPLVDPDDDWPLVIDLSLLDTARIKSWSLKILDSDRGTLAREFRGTSDVWVSIQWDGTDTKDRAVHPGEYQAFLSATTLNKEQLEDSTSFIVRSPRNKRHDQKSVLATKKEPAPGPLPESPQTRKWSHLIRFSFNQSDLAGTGGLEVKQLAQSIKAFPDEGVVIEGFADLTEKNAEGLALRRAENIRNLLIEKHGIPQERLTVRAKEPRRALEGESLQKSVVFFVEVE
jgi:outer membrane protein OmpA-like peptidoglycan-associated protein